MRTPEQHRRAQRTVLFGALLMFNMVLVILQLWLFVAALENLLAGRHGVAIPAAIVSVVCLAVNWWMLVGVYRVERT